MTHNETEAERDLRVGANLTSKLVNKTIAKITMVDASDGRHGDSCYGRMSFEFTDGTFLVIDEIGQAGGMSYDVVPPVEIKTNADIDRMMNAVIDHVIEEFETLPTADTDTSVEPQLSDYDDEDMYWEAHAAWANEQSGETARRKAEVAAILGVEYYGKK